MCVVCVYFVFYRTLLKPGAKRYRISPYAPHILRPEMFCTRGCSTPEKEKTPDTAPATQVQHPVSFRKD